MLGITAPEVAAHLLITAGPETCQVLGDRGRPARGREQMHRHRELAAQHRGGAGGAKHLLQLHRQNRLAVGVIQRHIATRWHPQGGGEQVVQLGAKPPRCFRPKGFAEIETLELVQAAQSFEMGAKPLVEVGEQMVQVAIGPGLPQSLVG